MNRTKSLVLLLSKAMVIVVLVICGAIFGLYKMRVSIPALNTPKIYANFDSMGARAELMKGRVVGLYESYFGKKQEEEVHAEHSKIVVTSPLVRDETITQEYVCQIHSRRHIDVCAFEDGYLSAIQVKEGQAVKEGDILFGLNSVLYKAKLDAEKAERDLALLEYNNTVRLHLANGVSENEVKLFGAKLAKRQAMVDQAQAELDFTSVKAKFDGIINRLNAQEGSLVKEGDVLTTLSDNAVMWVYFNVPEKRYLEYMGEVDQNLDSPDIELVLANQKLFKPNGIFDPIRRQIGAIEGQFNNETGNIAFRADFPNPERVLRHGQTGNVRIKRLLKNAIIIPQRATYEVLDKQYVYVVDEKDVVHQRPITVEHELDDIFVIKSGLKATDKIVLEGVRQVRDGEKVEEYETRTPEVAIKTQKQHAE